MRSTTIVIAGFVACGALAGTPALAEHCFDGWEDPVVCEVTVTVEGAREAQYHQSAESPRSSKERQLPGGEGKVVRIAPRQRATLKVSATDQRGRVFPPDKVIYRIDSEEECAGVVSWDRPAMDEFLVEAAGEDGTCSVILWVPGNLNIEVPLTFVVGREPAKETEAPTTTSSTASFVAESVFRALLGRAPPEDTLRSLTEQVQMGRTEDVVRGVVGSEEFVRRRASLTPEELVDSLYQGLLGRQPDPGGARTYRGKLTEAEGIVEVVMTIIRSAEYRRHLAESRARTPHTRDDG